MGYVPPHMYTLTGDEGFKEDFDREQRRTAIGIAITGGLCFLMLIGGTIYSILLIGG